MKVFSRVKKWQFFLVLIIILSIISIHIVQAVTAQGTEPGSDGDPLVTQGYVDKKVNDLTTVVNQLTAKINDLTTANAALTTKTNDLTAANTDLAAKVSDLTNKNADLTVKVSDLATKLDSLSKKVDDTQVKPMKFVLVKVPKGKQLSAGSSAEMIVVSGQARAVKGQVGILLDISTGLDAKSGYNLTAKHLYFSSTDDGRGFKAVTDVSVLFKGSYTLK